MSAGAKGRQTGNPLRKRQASADRAHYPDLSPMSTGLGARCPRCGEGRLFASLLKPVRHCTVCGLDMSFAEEGDGPAVFAILILGFVVAGLALAFEKVAQPPLWLHIVIWLPVIFALSIWALRAIKGIMIATQYRTGAAEGRLADPE